MKHYLKQLLAGLLLCVSLPLISAAQAINITGTVIDSVTSQPVANAQVALNGNSALTTLTDAAGKFSLTGQTAVIHQVNPGTIMNQTDATAVDVFNSRGERIAQTTTNGLPQLFGQGRSGLYYARSHEGWASRFAVGMGFRPGNHSARQSKSLVLGKSLAGYSITISKNNYASKQVSVGSATTNAGTVRLRAVQPTLPVTPMKRISLNVPAYVSPISGGNVTPWSGPQLANDTSVYNGWSSVSIPVWIAYDLSAATAQNRQKVLVVWYDPSIGGYPGEGTSGLPRDYTIEINTAPGGTGSAPTTGWVTVATVSGNAANSRHHEINMAGANWIRMNISGSPDDHVHFDMDVYSVPEGVTDSWLFLGDSITSMALARPWCTLQTHVYDGSNKLAYPPQVNGAVGGTSSWQGLQIIDSMMMSTPARFIALCYGTNDHAVDGASTLFSRMDTICMKIIAAGRIPVVPIVPWPNTPDQTEALQKVDMLHQIWDKYPTQVMRGPDLYTLFKDRGDLIAAGDVHPNNAGMEVLRQAWSVAMLKVYQ